MAQHAQQLQLASLGRLSASIAHEIRNPLGAISHAGQLLAESEHLDKNDLRLTQIISDHSKRLNTIVESVMSVSRRKSSNIELINQKNFSAPSLATIVTVSRYSQRILRLMSHREIPRYALTAGTSGKSSPTYVTMPSDIAISNPASPALFCPAVSRPMPPDPTWT